jgi:hypothetical protein
MRRATRLTPVAAILEALHPGEDLPARPVTYRGTRTRSTLEAKWLVWLDHLGIAWEYEPRPIQLDGRPRWPDLWLPEQAAWIEVKPAGTPADLHYSLSVAEQTGSPLLWVAGAPWSGDYSVSLAPFGCLDEVRGLRFAVGRRDHSELWVCDPGSVVSVPLPVREHREDEDFPLWHCEALLQAYRAASTWRFDER